jgi:hypothetical protein
MRILLRFWRWLFATPFDPNQMSEEWIREQKRMMRELNPSEDQ